MKMRKYKAIETLWQYLQLDHCVVKSDLIMVLCSNDLRVAEYAAQLYHLQLAPKILFSGGLGRFTEDLFEHPEAETFAQVARDLGVPKEAILLETKASNTGENVLFSYQMLNDMNDIPEKVIIVQKPFMERRSLATFVKQWPIEETQVVVTSQKGKFEDYLCIDMPIDLVVDAMVSDFERIRDYPAKGFQIEQPIPNEVHQAYEVVKALGYYYCD
jgi:uncharacterized SAM-binding protein YcdF (DUF218 family)